MIEHYEIHAVMRRAERLATRPELANRLKTYHQLIRIAESLEEAGKPSKRAWYRVQHYLYHHMDRIVNELEEIERKEIVAFL